MHSVFGARFTQYIVHGIEEGTISGLFKMKVASACMPMPCTNIRSVLHV